MHRFFVDPGQLDGDLVPLENEVLHHLARVLRLSAGNEVELLDGSGRVCRCRIESLGRKGGTARILECRQQSETAFPIRLLQGLPKGDKLDLVLQKGTELGITGFLPILAGRSIPALAPEREARRLARWQRIVKEAARQCRRTVLPEIGTPMPLEAALETCREGLRLMLWEGGQRPLRSVLSPSRPASATLLVGPEGGFAPEEARAAEAAGFVAVGAGPRILRSETAGFALAAVLQYLYGDLGTEIPAEGEQP